MNIGIAAPIEIASLKRHLPDLSEHELKLGLGGTAVNILIDGFINAGHFVTVFTLDSTITKTCIVQGPHLKIVIGHFRLGSRFKWFDFCRSEYMQIYKFIQLEKSLDIVNAHWSYEFAIGAILSKVPHLITFRDHSQTILKLTKHPYRLTRLLMDSWVRLKGKNFSFNSLYLKELIKLQGEVIPNPIKSIEISAAKIFDRGKIKFKICYIANGWDYRKNPEAALEGFSLLIQEFTNVELHLIGSGFESFGNNFDRVSKNGLSSKVFFRGPLKHNEFMSELSDFDIMLHTAREESFGNNLIEAMAKGIPIVAGKSAGAVPWVLENGKSGCLVDIESPEDIAAGLKRLLSDSKYYDTLSLNGINNLKTRFIQEQVCNIYLDVFKSIIGKHGI
jgi:glycosyltransferase involved in cell wall biosynthesis